MTRKTCDVAVIGAGIMGCATAFHLARRGLRVVVLDKDGIGMAATGQSSAIIRQHYSNELTARMALHSLQVFQHFGEQVGGECGFRKTGFVVMVPADDRPGLEANVVLQRRVGIETRILAAEELREVVPGVETADLVAAAFEPESGYADPHLTTGGYAEAARQEGAEFLVDHEVTGIRFDGDRVTGVRTPNGDIDAPLVVNCAGPWGARVAAMAGVSVPINACRVQVAIFRQAPDAPPHPVVLDFVHATYIRPEIGNLTIAGLIDPAEADNVVDPDDYAQHTDDEFIPDLAGRLLRRFPGMERSESTGGYAGLYAVTPDWHPIIDEVPPGSGCYICSGFSGHGFKLGPAVGVMMADLLTGDPDPVFSPDLFRFSRYQEHTPIHGTYEYSIAG